MYNLYRLYDLIHWEIGRESNLEQLAAFKANMKVEGYYALIVPTKGVKIWKRMVGKFTDHAKWFEYVDGEWVDTDRIHTTGFDEYLEHLVDIAVIEKISNEHLELLMSY